MKKLITIIAIVASVFVATSACATNTALTLQPFTGYASQISEDGDGSGGFTFGVDGTYIVDRWLFDIAYAVVPTEGSNAQAITVGFGSVFGMNANYAFARAITKPSVLRFQAESAGESYAKSIYPYIIAGASIDPTGSNLHGIYIEGGTMIPIETIDQWTRLGVRGTYLPDDEEGYRLAVYVAPVMAW